MIKNEYKIILEDGEDSIGVVYQATSVTDALAQLAKTFEIDEATKVTITNNG